MATATLSLPASERHVAGVGNVSDGTLAGSVLELAQTLTKQNAVLRERAIGQRECRCGVCLPARALAHGHHGNPAIATPSTGAAA